MLISVVLLLVALPACVLVLLNIGQFRHCFLIMLRVILSICGLHVASCAFAGLDVLVVFFLSMC